MQIIQKCLQKNFTIADNRIMQCSGLSFEARGLYFYMLSLPDDWEFSEERLARNGGIGLCKCKRILKELFDVGLLKRDFYNNEKGHRKAIYTLFDFETIENPMKENPTLENRMKDTSIIYNKEINNNKELKNTKTQTRAKTKKGVLETSKRESLSNESLSANSLENNSLFDFGENKNANMPLNETKTHNKSILEGEGMSTHTQDKENDLMANFEAIWKQYPKKNGKSVAFNSYKRAMKGYKSLGQWIAPVTHQEIEVGMLNYLKANFGQELRFIKDLSTFINQQTFKDFQTQVKLNTRVGGFDNNSDYMNIDKSKYIPNYKSREN